MSLRAGHFLEALARVWAVTVVSPVPEPPETPAPEGLSWIRVPGVPATDSLPWLAERTLLRDGVAATLAGTSFDAALVWCGAEFVAAEIPDFPPAVADRIDCGTLQSWRDARRERRVRQAIRILRHAGELLRYERTAFRPYRTVVVTGPDDRRVLARVSRHARVLALPNGVGIEPEGANGERDRPTVIFTGVLGYAPNVEAIRHFVLQVWPAVRARVPDAVFVVAGRDPVPEVRALAEREGVELHPNVPDMREELRRAWVAVAPMRSGSGIKNKVLEAWALGRPAVLTSLATNGLELDESARSLVVDPPAEMAARIATLLEDGETRRKLGDAARRLAAARHSWPALGEGLDALLREAAGLPSASGTGSRPPS